MKIEFQKPFPYETYPLQDLEDGQLFINSLDGPVFVAGNKISATIYRNATKLDDGAQHSMEFDVEVIRVYGKLSYSLTPIEDYE